jgi:hypothetical protein
MIKKDPNSTDNIKAVVDSKEDSEEAATEAADIKEVATDPSITEENMITKEKVVRTEDLTIEKAILKDPNIKRERVVMRDLDNLMVKEEAKVARTEELLDLINREERKVTMIEIMITEDKVRDNNREEETQVSEVKEDLVPLEALAEEAREKKIIENE